MGMEKSLEEMIDGSDRHHRSSSSRAEITITKMETGALIMISSMIDTPMHHTHQLTIHYRIQILTPIIHPNQITPIIKHRLLIVTDTTTMALTDRRTILVTTKPPVGIPPIRTGAGPIITIITCTLVRTIMTVPTLIPPRFLIGLSITINQITTLMVTRMVIHKVVNITQSNILGITSTSLPHITIVQAHDLHLQNTRIMMMITICPSSLSLAYFRRTRGVHQICFLISFH
jgi:hypothetical protein